MKLTPLDEDIQPQQPVGGMKLTPLDDDTDDFAGDVNRHFTEAFTKDLPNIAVQTGKNVGKFAASMMPGQIAYSGIQAMHGTPIKKTVVGEGYEAGKELMTGTVQGEWQAIKDALSAAKSGGQMLLDDELPFKETEFGQKFRERPISAPLGAATAFYGGYKGLKGLRGAPKAIPEGTPNVFDTTPEGVPSMPKTPPETSPAPGAKPPRPPVHEQLQEVADYLSDKMEPAMKKKSFWQNMGRSWEEKGLGMTIGELSGPPGMIRKLRAEFGEKFVKDLAKRAQDKGVTKGFFNFQTGDAIQRMKHVSGVQLEAFRNVSAKRGAAHNMENLLGHLEEKFGPEYRSGVGEAATEFDNILETIRQTPPDVASMAKRVTDTYKLITGNKLIPPKGPTRRVLSEVNRLNNEIIADSLNAKELPYYRENLIDNASAHIYDKMHGFQFGRTFGGRTGPAGIWNTIKDIGGRKIMEKVYTTVGRKMQTKPYKPGMLTADILQAVDEALNEMIEQAGMSQQ